MSYSKICGHCHHPKADHTPSRFGRACPVEFSSLNGAGERVNRTPAEMANGVQHNRRSQARWVSPGRLAR